MVREVIQGEQETFVFTLTTKDKNTGITSPYDLTGNTEISCCFKVSSTVAQVNRVAAPAQVTELDLTGGKIQAVLETADTDGLPQGIGSVEITVTKAGGVVKKWRIDDLFQVKEKFC